MTNTKNSTLLFCGILVVMTAMTPARAWIRFFNTMSWVITLFVFLQHDNYKKVIPQGLLVSGIVYIMARCGLGLIKGVGGAVYIFRLYLSAMLNLFVPVAIFMAILAYADYRQFRRFVYAIALVMLPFLLLTIYMPIGTSRMNMATAMMISESLMEEVEEVNRMGVMTYAPIHSLPFLVVSSVMLGRHLRTMREKMAAAIFASILVVTIVRSGFGYAICMTFALLFLSFAGAKRRATSTIILLLLGMLGVFLVKTGVVASILKSVQEGLGYGNVIGSKAEEVEAVLQGRAYDASDFSGRLEIYKMAIRAFVRYPLLGAPPTVETGGHAYWLDTLGQWGIAGFVVEAVMMATAFRLERRILPKFQQYYYELAFVFYMIILCVKAGGMNVQTPTFFLMFPSMLILREDDFYFASNRVRRMFNIPPRMLGQQFLRPKR